MKQLILVLIAFVFTISCAKDRGTEGLRPEVTKYWLDKAALTGDGETRDIYYSKATVVRTSLDGGPVFASLQSDMAVGYFDFSEQKLTFKSVQGAYRGRETSLTSTPIIYQWPITHHEAQLQTIDGKTTNKEIDDDRKPWFQKKKFKADFGVADAIVMPGHSEENLCWKLLSTRQVENSVRTEPGYFTFVVEAVFSRKCYSTAKSIVNNHPTFTVQYRYSFRKMEQSDYKPMVYKGEQDERMRKFGYFQSVFEEENPKDGLTKNIFFVNRWDPNKTHVFNFTKDFPEKYKYMYRDIFKKTNDVFEEKKLKIKFVVLNNTEILKDGQVIDTGVEKEFGDLRYSFVNLIETVDASAPLGYGPSDANPFTGEIISANLNVWSGMIKYYLKILEQSAKRNPEWFQSPANSMWEQDFEKSKWVNSDLFLRMKDVLGNEEPTTWTQNWSDRDDLRDFFAHMVNKTTYGFPFWNMFTQGDSFQTVKALVERPIKAESAQAASQFEKLKSIGSPVHNDGINGALFEKNIAQNLMKDYYFFKKTEHTTMIRPRPIIYKPLEEMATLKGLLGTHGASAMSLHRMPDVEMLKDFTKAMNEHNEHEMNFASLNKRGHCILAAQESLAGVERFIIDGFTTDEIAENIIYRTSIHEFGHNLNLRHNFYGSVDKDNFLPPSVPVTVAEYVLNADGTKAVDKDGKAIQTGKKIPVLDESGKPRMWPNVSSSVMDYVRLQDEYYSTQEWEPYDKAALWFAYSGGKVDEGVNYLFCTDEHTLTNALCNRFDKGTTPSEVVMSLIEAYEDGYYSRNYRFGRAYWNTAGYSNSIVTTMRELKEFLPMWRTAFYESALREELSKKGIKSHQAEQMVTEVSRDIKQAIRLSLAFYHSVLQQSAVDKPFRSEYDEFTGGLKRMGIGFDKLAAIYFLAGDDQLYYNPNRVMIEASYLTYAGLPEFAKIMDKIVEDIVTVRVDMEPWFISMGRQLYAQSAMNFTNREDESFINQIKIKKYSAFELEQYFGYSPKPQLVTDLVTLKQSKDADFIPNERVALVRVNSNYFMFSEQGSPFAYDIYKNVKQSEEFQSSSVEGKLDIQELYYIYTVMSGGLP